jgi:hypothetical protein
VPGPYHPVPAPLPPGYKKSPQNVENKGSRLQKMRKEIDKNPQNDESERVSWRDTGEILCGRASGECLQHSVAVSLPVTAYITI